MVLTFDVLRRHIQAPTNLISCFACSDSLTLSALYLLLLCSRPGSKTLFLATGDHPFIESSSATMSDATFPAFPLIQTKSRPKGTDSFEKLRASTLQELYDSIPSNLHLPKSIIDNPPLDVTPIPTSCGLLSDLGLEITENYDATSLASAIASKKYSAVVVATALL